MKRTKNKRNLFARIVILIRNLAIIFFAVSISWVVLARFVPVFVTPLMIIRSVESLIQGEMPRNSKDWVSIDKISHNIVQAVVASEDNLFMEHHGFSIEDIQKALKHNQKGKRIRGGSTISQQTAKNVFLWPDRSYVRKGVEAYFTVLIEFIWPKERIMEVYLNVIEMGDGIYGIQAASEEYFNKDAKQLTKSQAALIAACLPNPRKYSAKNPSSYIQRRKAKIMSLMGKLKQINFNKEEQTTKKKKKK
jgi:monofunctional biosynthetic peptidoglycan transglycosylase